MELLGEIEKRQARPHEENQGGVFHEFPMGRADKNLENGEQDAAADQGQELGDEAQIFFLDFQNIGRWIMADIDVHGFLEFQAVSACLR